MTVASFVGFMSFTLVMPFLPLYFHQLGVTDVGAIAMWSGLSLGATPALTALMAPAWGSLSDRFGRKIMVERSLLSFVIVMAATGYVTEPWHVLALRTIQGFFAGYGPLMLTMAVESSPPQRVASSIGLVQTAQRLGPTIGPVVGGALAQVVGLRRAFLVASLFYAAAFVLVLVLYHEPTASRLREKTATEGRISFRSVLAFQNFVLLMFAIFAIQFVDKSFGPILPLFVAEIGVPLARVPLVSGILFSVLAGAAALGHHVCGRLLERRSPRAIIVSGAAMASSAVLMVGAARQVALLLLAMPVFGFGVGVAMTACYTAGSAVIPSRARGVGFGFLTSAALMGLALSPIFTGFLGAVSLRAVFVLDAVALVVVAWLVWRSMVEHGRTTEASASRYETEEMT